MKFKLFEAGDRGVGEGAEERGAWGESSWIIWWEKDVINLYNEERL
jgi:hypothetical protein